MIKTANVSLGKAKTDNIVGGRECYPGFVVYGRCIESESFVVWC
jgi:hypothetical protein